MSLIPRRKGNRPVRARRGAAGVVGHWQIVVRPYGLAAKDVAFFRGVPTQLGSFGFEDPFGPATLQLTFPAVTLFDKVGFGDLDWILEDADVDLVWVGPLPPGYPGGGYRWEGYFASFDWGDNGFTVQCAGANHQHDLTLAKPEYLARPLPYEVAIARTMTGRLDLRTKPLRIEWPAWWSTRYSDPPAGTPTYMIPSGVKAGQNWSALVTRSTGSWDARLTGFAQSLLSSMYTERGRWTIDLDPGRQPVMRHLDLRMVPRSDDILIDAVQPGIKVRLSEDFSQSANVAHGQGSSLAGVGYSGMEVSPDGLTTTYRPLAALRQVDPVTDKNGWFQRGRFRREVLLQLQPGLDETDARKVAVSHLTRFGNPGYVGSIELESDPTVNGVSFPHFLVRAGFTVRVPRLFGNPEGVLLHVTKSDHDPASRKTTLTVDSRYRDMLTVDEVRLRTRDALTVTRLLVAGGYQPPIPDQLLPWDYAGGSGYVPSGAQLSSKRLFDGMPAGIPFPWTDWTRARPPRSASWKSCYIRLGPATGNANDNWTSVSDKSGSKLGIPIKMSQAGTIRLLQVAAYDKDGNVLPVSFHLSLYYSRGVNYTSMPSMPTEFEGKFPPYQGGQHFPFFPAAWETYKDDGTQQNPASANAVETSGLIRAWGSNYEKAGHWPGSSASGDPATGLLVDETTWSFDTTHFDSTFDPFSPTKNKANPLAGQVYAMLWCDMQKQQEVFFAGRMFRVEPGTGV